MDDPQEGYRRTGRRDECLDHAQVLADKLVMDAECHKAATATPKGNDHQQDIRNILSILKSKCDDDGDDEFFHITCHLDSALKQKISKGEFVDLEKLLPKTRGQIMNPQMETDIELVCRDGVTFQLPVQKETKITNVRRWEQAFRVYAAVYSEANPEKAAEIWQYVHIINSAASSFV